MDLLWRGRMIMKFFCRKKTSSSSIIELNLCYLKIGELFERKWFCTLSTAWTWQHNFLSGYIVLEISICDFMKVKLSQNIFSFVGGSLSSTSKLTATKLLSLPGSWCDVGYQYYMNYNIKGPHYEDDMPDLLGLTLYALCLCHH